MSKKKKSVNQVVTFRVEDEAVAEILHRAENESLVINDALRKCGDQATLDLLRQDVERAKQKFADAQDAIHAAARNKRHAR